MSLNIKQDLEIAKKLFSVTQVCAAEEKKVSELIEKQDKSEITVSVIGQFKRGKSTLVNALLGEEILPVGIVPVTSVVTKIEYGKKNIRVFFDRGDVKQINSDELSKYVNEQENPDNKLGVLSIAMNSESDFIKDGLILVDTPGVGSVHKHNTDAAYAFVKESDGVIFMLGVDSPVNEIEIEFLKNAKEFASKFYFVVNKIDNVSESELAQYISYCKTLLAAVLDSEDVNIMAVSAKKGIGIDELKKVLIEDMRAASRDILENSAKMKLIDLIKQSLSKIRLYSKLLELSISKITARYEKMKEFTDLLEIQNRDLASDFKKRAGEIDVITLAKECTLAVNDTKIAITKKVKEIFDIEYVFELSDMEILKTYSLTNAKGNADEVINEFLAGEASARNEILKVLETILMHKENNTITISRNLEDLNRAYRNLRSLQNRLQISN
ncbi:MAG: dynamin family protein [Eubacteriales bacterium]